MAKEDFLREHVEYLARVRELRDGLQEQVDNGWFSWADIHTLEEHDSAIEAYSNAIDGGDDVFILLERRVLDNTIVGMTRDILTAKMAYVRRMGQS